MDRGAWTAKAVKRPRQQPAHPQYANYWALLTRKWHTIPHSAQPQHTNHWALRTRKRHQQEHRPQRPTERSDPTQHAKGRAGDCPGPHKGATTVRNVTQVGGGGHPFECAADDPGGSRMPRAHNPLDPTPQTLTPLTTARAQPRAVQGPGVLQCAFRGPVCGGQGAGPSLSSLSVGHACS